MSDPQRLRSTVWQCVGKHLYGMATRTDLHSPFGVLAGESYPIRKWVLWAGTCTLPMFGLAQKDVGDQREKANRGRRSLGNR